MMAAIYWLIVLFEYCLNGARAILVLDSMQMVACHDNTNICNNGLNLRIVLNASAEEVIAGSATIGGRITSGQTWTDSFGDWELTQSLDVDLDYRDASWVYQLLDKTKFSLQSEAICSLYEGECGPKSGHCVNEKNFTLELITIQYAWKYEIQNVDQWQANVSIQSPEINQNLKWAASNVEPSIQDEHVDVSIKPVFNRTTCYRDLNNLYYVVEDHLHNFYWTSKYYWQNKRNNFNLSVKTYKRDFDCTFQHEGWHTRVPFSADVTKNLGDQLRAWREDNWDWRSRDDYTTEWYFQDIMPGCTDLTEYADSSMRSTGPAVNDIFKVRRPQIIDYFQITIDLDHSFYVPLFTNAPIPSPSNPPTTKAPTTKSPASLSPSQSPTLTPVIPPTNAPSKSPTICFDGLWSYYEVAAKLEISSESFIDFSLPIVSENIIKSLASGLNIVKEFIRIDFFQYQDTTSDSQRRLQSNTQRLIVGFTIFATTEDEKIRFQTKLEETASHSVGSALTDKFPDIIMTTSIAHEMDECQEGTRLMTIAGQRKCESICDVNHYYDTASSSCKEQVEFSTTIVIQINYLSRVLFFGVGIIAWIATLCLGYGACKYCCCDESESEMNEESKRTRTKKSIKAKADESDSDL